VSVCIIGKLYGIVVNLRRSSSLMLVLKLCVMFDCRPTQGLNARALYSVQSRLIQRAQRVRAQGPQASGGPKQPMRYFFHLVK